MSFPQLRDILQLQPSKETWDQLTQLLDCWQDSDLELALEYAIEHTKSWNSDIKYLYLNDDNEIPRWIQLVTDLRYCTNNRELPTWIQNLTKLTTLNLWDCKSLENIDALQNLTNLTYLDLYGCRSLKIQPLKPYMTTREEVAEYQEILKKGKHQDEETINNWSI